MRRLTSEGIPWWPESLLEYGAAPADRSDWSYVLLEEIVGDLGELCRWPWPLADQRGHLFWPDGDAEAVRKIIVPIQLLQAVLYKPDLQRLPRAGDAFAVAGDAPTWR